MPDSYAIKRGEFFMLYNNGYVIKDLVDNEELGVPHSVYRGLQSFHSWPLDQKSDHISKKLTNAVMDYFEENNNYIEIMQDTRLLTDYVEHCRRLDIKIIILKIMSERNQLIAEKDLHEIEFLGYDCMATYDVSYLTEIHIKDGETLEEYESMRPKLNANGLLNTYEEVEEFIRKRNSLLQRGINLEDYWTPFPVRLSLVELFKDSQIVKNNVG